MTREQRIAIWVVTLIGMLVAWKLFGQGFGNFRTDQPFLARNYPAGPVDPSTALPAGIGYWWKASDLTSTPVNNWTDRVSGIVMTNSGATSPTWTTNEGVRFTRADSQFLRAETPITLYTSNAFLLIVKRIGDSVNQWIIGHDTLSQTWVRWNNANNWVTEGIWEFAASPINVVQDLIYSGLASGGASQDQGYTNGVLVYTSSTALMNSSVLGYFGTYADKANYGDFLMKELIIWTNGRFASATVVSNVHWYATNVWTYSP